MKNEIFFTVYGFKSFEFIVLSSSIFCVNLREENEDKTKSRCGIGMHLQRFEDLINDQKLPAEEGLGGGGEESMDVEIQERVVHGNALNFLSRKMPL